MTFATMQPEFEALNCKLLGLSIDSTYSHIAWLRTIKEKIEYKGMKGVEVKFPVISDLTMEVAKAFGMLQPAASTTQAVRAVFIIDPEGDGPRDPVLPAVQRAEHGRDQAPADRHAALRQAQDRHPGQLAAGRRRDRPAAGLVRHGQGARREARGRHEGAWTGSWS